GRKGKGSAPPPSDGRWSRDPSVASSSEGEDAEATADAGAERDEGGDGEAELGVDDEIAADPLIDDEEDAFAEPKDDDDAPVHSAPLSRPMSGTSIERLDPMAAYLREVQRHPLLTPEQTHALAAKFVETQDPRIAAQLVTANLRLVVKIAYEYRRAYKNIMDLVQEGNIGLMQAVKRYDPYRGVKLSSYAAWWIRAYILRFILNNWRLVKLGTTQAQRKLFFNLNKEKEKLRALGIDPEPHIIAERLGVEEKEVVDMDRRLSSGEASLDAPIGDGEGRSVSRMELLPSTSMGPEAELQRSEMDALVKEHLAAFRETLKGKDVDIFDRRMAAEDP